MRDVSEASIDGRNKVNDNTNVHANIYKRQNL